MKSEIPHELTPSSASISAAVRRVLAVAEQLVERDADREQVGRDVPAGEVGVGRLVRRRPRDGLHRVADAEAMLKSRSLAPERVSMTFCGLMSRWTSARSRSST